MRTAIIILFFSLSSFAQNRQYIHDGWKFKLENSKEIFQAKVPGTVHQDLMRVGMIDDIYYPLNKRVNEFYVNGLSHACPPPPHTLLLLITETGRGADTALCILLIYSLYVCKCVFILLRNKYFYKKNCLKTFMTTSTIVPY